jgi:hypothetical protein
MVLCTQEDKVSSAAASAEAEELEGFYARLASPAFLDAVSAVHFEPADFEKDEVRSSGGCGVVWM